MINFRKVALVTASVFALMATPAAAGCFKDTSKTLVQWQKNAGLAQPGPVALRTALEEGAGSLEQGITNASTHISSDLPAECRGEIADQNIRAYLGLGQSTEPAPKPAVTQSAPEVASTASAVEGKPVTEVTAAPAANTEGKASETAVQRDISAGRSKATAYFARPAAERDPKRDTEMADLLNKINKHEELLGQLPKDKDGNIDIAKLTPTQQTELRTTQTEVRIASSRIEEIVGRDWLDGMTAGNTIGLLLLLIAGILGYRKLRAAIALKANDERFDVVSQIAHEAKVLAEGRIDEVAALTIRMDAAEADIADAGKDRKKIVLPDDLEAVLKALADGESTDVAIIIDGDRGLIGFTKFGNEQVKTTDIEKQTQAMNIAGICGKVNRAIGGGRVKMRPIVQSAAA